MKMVREEKETSLHFIVFRSSRWRKWNGESTRIHTMNFSFKKFLIYDEWNEDESLDTSRDTIRRRISSSRCLEWEIGRWFDEREEKRRGWSDVSGRRRRKDWEWIRDRILPSRRTVRRELYRRTSRRRRLRPICLCIYIYIYSPLDEYTRAHGSHAFII